MIWVDQLAKLNPNLQSSMQPRTSQIDEVPTQDGIDRYGKKIEQNPLAIVKKILRLVMMMMMMMIDSSSPCPASYVEMGCIYDK